MTARKPRPTKLYREEDYRPGLGGVRQWVGEPPPFWDDPHFCEREGVRFFEGTIEWEEVTDNDRQR